MPEFNLQKIAEVRNEMILRERVTALESAKVGLVEIEEFHTALLPDFSRTEYSLRIQHAQRIGSLQLCQTPGQAKCTEFETV